MQTATALRSAETAGPLTFDVQMLALVIDPHIGGVDGDLRIGGGQGICTRLVAPATATSAGGWRAGQGRAAVSAANEALTRPNAPAQFDAGATHDFRGPRVPVDLPWMGRK